MMLASRKVLLAISCLVLCAFATAAPITRDKNYDGSATIAKRVYNDKPPKGTWTCTEAQIGLIDYCFTKVVEQVRETAAKCDAMDATLKRLYPAAAKLSALLALKAEKAHGKDAGVVDFVAFRRISEDYFGKLHPTAKLRAAYDSIQPKADTAKSDAEKVQHLSDLMRAVEAKDDFRFAKFQHACKLATALKAKLEKNSEQFELYCYTGAESVADTACGAMGPGAFTDTHGKIWLCPLFLGNTFGGGIKNVLTRTFSRPICQILGHELFHNVAADDVANALELRKQSWAKQDLGQSNDAPATVDKSAANNADSLGFWVRGVYKSLADYNNRVALLRKAGGAAAKEIAAEAEKADKVPEAELLAKALDQDAPAHDIVKGSF